MRKSVGLYSIIITSLILCLIFYRSPVKLEQGVYMDKPQLIPPFELIDNKGKIFRKENLVGHWSLLFFGFSSCEIICPSTLQNLKKTYDLLPESKKTQVILISVDPKQDSIQKLNQYVHLFNPNFIALRGEMSSINALQQGLHVPVSSTPKSHGTEILLINPNAQVQAYFYFPFKFQTLAADLMRIIK